MSRTRPCQHSFFNLFVRLFSYIIVGFLLRCFFLTAKSRRWFCHRGRCVTWRGHWKCWLMQFFNCWWWKYRGNCYVLDHVLSYDGFAGNLTGTSGKGCVCPIMVHWGLMSCCFVWASLSLSSEPFVWALRRLLLLSWMIQYEYGEASLDSMYPDFH